MESTDLLKILKFRPKRKRTFYILLFSFLAQLERFQPGYVGVLGEEEIKMLFEKGMPSLTDIGVLGDPTKASKEHGKIYIEKMVEFLTAEIKKGL